MIKKMFSQIFNQFFLMEKVHVGEGWGGRGNRTKNERRRTNEKFNLWVNTSSLALLNGIFITLKNTYSSTFITLTTVAGTFVESLKKRKHQITFLFVYQKFGLKKI